MNPFKKHHKPEPGPVHGSSGATADAAAGADQRREERDPDAPYSRPAKPLAETEKPDQLADKEKQTHDHQEALLDEAVEETFPSSDPISPKHIT